jgi:hydroxymethylpyrimidine pyrophosphatase-like HAD family hydrolase
MPAISLVVTDLDGTLWDAGARIHARTLDAMAQLEQRGTPVLVATGRRLRTAMQDLAREGLAPPGVFLDGSVGRHLTSGETFHRVAFERPAAAAVLGAFTGLGLSPCLYVDRPDADVVVGDSPSTNPGHLQQVGRWLAHEDPWRVVETEDVLAVGLVGLPRAVLAAAAAAIGDHAEARVTRDLFFGEATLITRPAGISKWQGVLSYCAQAGLDPSAVLALGDGENDVELLTHASVSCVVSDGCEEALALADHVIEPAAAGGWCAVLDLV